MACPIVHAWLPFSLARPPQLSKLLGNLRAHSGNIFCIMETTFRDDLQEYRRVIDPSSRAPLLEIAVPSSNFVCQRIDNRSFDHHTHLHCRAYHEPISLSSSSFTIPPSALPLSSFIIWPKNGPFWLRAGLSTAIFFSIKFLISS